MSKKMIRLSKSCIEDAEKSAVMRVLDNGYLGMGDEVDRFEKSLTNFFGRPTICVVNGTAALQLALQSCGIGEGDEVLVQSLTYVATFQAISATGATPISCDIDAKTMTLDWRDAERRITENTKALVPVHYGGGVGDLRGIYSLASKRGLRVIEDAAHAFGSIYEDRKVGGFGDVACFSFDGIKNITSGEGGCVVTTDPEVLSRVQDARLLGVCRDTEMRYKNQRSWEFDVVSMGWRYHMSNIMAAIGIEQLKKFDRLSTARRKLSRLYDDQLKSAKNIDYLKHNYDDVVPHIYVVKLKGGVNRDYIREELLRRGIQTGIHYQPNHLLSIYRKQTACDLRVVNSVYPELLSLPLHPGLLEEDVIYVSDQLKELCG